MKTLIAIFMVLTIGIIFMPKQVNAPVKELKTGSEIPIETKPPNVEAVYISPTPTSIVIPTTIEISPTKTPLPTTDPVKPEMAQSSPKLTLSQTRVPNPTFTIKINPRLLVGCNNYTDLIKKSSEKYSVRYNLLYAMLNQESGCDPLITSKTGDSGIAQIHMASYPSITLSQAQDPQFSIDWAGKKLGYLVATFGEFDGLRSYNCGEALAKRDSSCAIVYANNILSKAQ